MGNGNKDFGLEIARLLPVVIREVTSGKNTVFSGSNITVNQMTAIEFLSEKGVSSMGEIAKTLNLSMSAATAVIDKMVKLGFAERKRSHKDRRVVLIELKKKGRETAKKIMMARKDVLNELFLPLESREKEFYLYIVRKIHGNIREKYENE